MPKRIADQHFDSIRRQLLELQRQSNLTTNHNSVKGRLRENFVKRFLENHLPSLADYATGQLLDVRDCLSPEMDIILRSSWSPRLHLDSGIEVVPVDSAVACIEVKSKLSTASMTSSSELKNSLLASFRIKSLHRQNIRPASMAWGQTYFSTKEKTPYLLVAYQGPKLDTLRRHIGEFGRSPDVIEDLKPYSTIDPLKELKLEDYCPDVIVVLDPPYYYALDDDVLVPKQDRGAVYLEGESCLSLFFVYLTRLVELWNVAPPLNNFKAYTDPFG